MGNSPFSSMMVPQLITFPKGFLPSLIFNFNLRFLIYTPEGIGHVSYWFQFIFYWRGLGVCLILNFKISRRNTFIVLLKLSLYLIILKIISFLLCSMLFEKLEITFYTSFLDRWIRVVNLYALRAQGVIEYGNE